MTKLFGFLAASSEKRPWLVVICVAVITVFLMTGMAFLKTEFSQESMLSDKYESVKALNTVQKEFGGMAYQNMLIVSDDVTSGGVAEKLLLLSPGKLEKAGIEKGQVLRVETYLDVMKKMAEAQGMIKEGQPFEVESFLDSMKRMAEAQGMKLPENLSREMLLEGAVQQFLGTPIAKEQVIGKTLSNDEKATLVKLQLDQGMTEKEQVRFAEKIEEYFNKEFGGGSAKVYAAGNASMQKDSQEFMAKQTTILFGIAILFIMLILYMTFRRISDVFLLMFVIIVGIFWIIGLMGWVGIPYTTMSVAIMPLMLGINIAYVIHILSRYYEEREGGGDVFFSTTTSVKTVGVAVFLTATTTVFGFSSFLIADMAPMRDFGKVCMIGIAFSFLLSLTLLPALVVIRDRRKKADKLEVHLEKMRQRRRESRYGVVVDKSLVNIALLAHRHPWVITAVIVALLGFGGFAIANVKTGADIRAMMPDDMPSSRAGAMVSRYFGAQNFDVILVKGDVNRPETLKAMLETEERLVNDRRNDPKRKSAYNREATISIADILVGEDRKPLPQTEEGVRAALAGLGKQMDLSAWVSKNGDYAVIMAKSEWPRNEDESATNTAILKDAARAGSAGGLEMSTTGVNVLIADLLGNIVSTQLETSALALLLCLAILIIVFRSFFYGLATLVVVICGMTAEIIFLYLVGWPLDFMTVTVASLVIGAGIDFGIHITHRYREQHLGKGLPLEDSVKSTVLHVGRALIAGAFTTAGVFAILGISTMMPMRHFGWTTAVGLLAALLGALFVLPSLLVIVSRFKDRREARKEGSPAPEVEAGPAEA